jgi:Mn2+/Fe2+ NRAMP family transporter
MESLLSSRVAPAAFGLALLAAGQLSTFTGTIAGQVRHWHMHLHQPACVVRLQQLCNIAASRPGLVAAATCHQHTKPTLTLQSPLPPPPAFQVVLRGFMNISLPTWLRRLLTRGAAVLPAALLQALGGDRLSYRWEHGTAQDSTAPGMMHQA